MTTNFILLRQASFPRNYPTNQTTQRIHSIDILRGAVMIIMALDHVRDFLHAEAFTDSPTNLATTTPFLFFTRWITHYCAPVFIFLSGVSAFIAGEKRTKKELSGFLIKRGFWLVLVELIVINFSLTFDPHYKSFFLQVIWAIGWSMILLGLLVRTSLVVIATVGIIILLGHNLLDYIQLPEKGGAGILWNLLFSARWTEFNLNTTRTFVVAYAILPWTSVMLWGYVAGKLFQSSVSLITRKRVLLSTGLFFLLLFIGLRLINLYGDPSPWNSQKNELFSFLSFINTTKYPVSLLYLLMTLGPALIIMSLLENKLNKFTSFLTVYGKVPLFYYVLHFFLIHIVCMAFFLGMGYTWSEAVDPQAPLVMLFRPVQFGTSLWVVYLVWLGIIFVLYKPCKWFAKYKSTHKHVWLSYI